MKFGLLRTVKFTFRPIRVFQHLEGRFLCTVDRGREVGCQDTRFDTSESEGRVVWSFLQKIVSRQPIFMLQIKVLIQEGIAKSLSYSIGVQDKL